MVELSLEQGRDVANFLPKAIVSSLSAGVDKYFWFIMPYYRERDKMLFGLLREDMTPTAGYCSLAACTYALGKADYLGKVDSDDVHAHVFQRGDGSLAVAFWTDDGKKTLKVQASVKKATLVDLMGVEQELNVSGSVLEVEAGPSVRYLILDSVSLMSNMRMGYPREKTEIKTYDPENVSHVVLRLQFPRKCRDKKLETYLLPVDSPTKISVELCNFGKNEFSGKLKLQLPEGYQGTLSDDDVSIAPMGRITGELELSSDGGVAPEPGRLRVDLLNTSGGIEAFILVWIAVKPD